MKVAQVGKDDAGYPQSMMGYLADSAPDSVAALGDLSLLGNQKLALFCSVKCPGDIILRSYDLAVALRTAGVAVAGGFHSPMEKECLALLLRGAQPVVVCPARGIETMQMPVSWRKPVDEGRLLLVSPFAGTQRRPTAEMSVYRNRFVAALADRVFVAYAEPGGKTEEVCRKALEWGKVVYTFESGYNKHVVTMGARPVGPDDADWVNKLRAVGLLFRPCINSPSILSPRCSQARD